MIINYFPINVFILSILGYDLIWWEENVENLRLPQSRNHTHRHFHRLYIIFCGVVRVSWIYDKAEFQQQIVGNMNTVDLQNCRNKISRLSILLEYVNTFYTNLMWIRVICTNHRKLLNLYKLKMHIYRYSSTLFCYWSLAPTTLIFSSGSSQKNQDPMNKATLRSCQNLP